jgi:hypothetical protein
MHTTSDQFHRVLIGDFHDADHDLRTRTGHSMMIKNYRLKPEFPFRLKVGLRLKPPKCSVQGNRI